MVQTKVRLLSFEEYLSYEDSEDGLYELFNGALIKLPTYVNSGAFKGLDIIESPTLPALAISAKTALSAGKQ